MNLAGGGWVTFSLDTAGGSTYTPEPGAENLQLTKPDANTYRITDTDGTISDFTMQGAAWTLASSRSPESSSTTRYVYDTSNARALLTKVINPVESGVDDANSCTAATLPAGCEVLEYVYATATTSGLSQTVFGDYVDHVKQVKLWASDPSTGTVSATVVTEYRYDVDGELREVWDPRVSGPDLALGKTATSSTACNANEGPEKAVNGTVGAGNTDKWCSSTSPRWLQVDLGTSTAISSVVLSHAAAGGETANWNTRDFTIQVSTDASTWSTVATVTGNTDAVTRHQFAATNARYIKLNITTPSQNGNSAARIYELEAYTGAPPLKTLYNYGLGGRVTSATPPGELPWQFVYANPDIDAAAVRWDLDNGIGHHRLGQFRQRPRRHPRQRYLGHRDQPGTVGQGGQLQRQQQRGHLQRRVRCATQPVVYRVGLGELVRHLYHHVPHRRVAGRWRGVRVLSAADYW